MPHPPVRGLSMRHPIAILYVEELKAVMRGRFSWLGAGVVLLALGGLATVGTQDTWLDGFGIIGYFLVPLTFIPLSAGLVASPRTNRFVESVFTAPVDRGDWLVAKVGVLLTLAVAYVAALVPMTLVYVADVGVPFLLTRFLLWTPGILLMSVAIGTLIGVLFIGRSVAAPTATGMGILLVYAGLVPLQELMVAQGNGDGRTARLALMSPAVLLKNALGFALVTTSVPATTTATWISAAVITAAAFGLAAWIFLRTQGVETWETTRRQRWTIGIALAAMAILPPIAADHNYDRTAPAANRAPAIRGLFARANSPLALTPPGGQPPARCCGTILNRELTPLATDQATTADLFVLLPVDVSKTVTSMNVHVAGDAGLTVTVDPAALASATSHLETRTYPADFEPSAADGQRIHEGWAARIPVTLDPAHPWDIGGDRYPLTVTATYQVGGEAAPRSITARAAVDAQVAPALGEMALASSVLPLFCFGAAFARWRRTR